MNAPTDFIDRRNSDDLDNTLADSCGWRVDLPDKRILLRLVAPNAERGAADRCFAVRWLLPGFQTKTKYSRAPTEPTIDYCSQTRTVAEKPNQTENKQSAKQKAWPSDPIEQNKADNSTAKALRSASNLVIAGVNIMRFAHSQPAIVWEILRSTRGMWLV